MTGFRKLQVRIVERALRTPFVTARGARRSQRSLRVELSSDGETGIGESSGVGYAGETAEGMAAQVDAFGALLEGGADRHDLLGHLPPGGARAACDAALWDLEAKGSGEPVWRRAQQCAPPSPVTTAYTVSLGAPVTMARAAMRSANRPLLKVKIGGRDGLDLARLRAVRMAAPGPVLIADGNEGCAPAELPALCELMVQLGYALLEQPLPRGEDEMLDSFHTPLPLCADESLATEDDVEAVAGRYDIGNIKLDKCGGLTAALTLAGALKAKKMDLFVGCMIGGAVSVAPAFLLAQKARYVDLDGPLWLAEDDHEMALSSDGQLAPPPGEVWGG